MRLDVYTLANMPHEKDAPVSEQDDSQNQPTNRKPYQKPTFRYERVFETQALACGKTPSACHGSPHTS
jgi:hypothetical protein